MQTRKFRAAAAATATAAAFFWQLLAVLSDSVGLCQPYYIFDLLDVGEHQDL